MLKIDIHTHILPENWPDLKERYGYGGFMQLGHHGPGCARMMQDGQLFREIEADCWDPDANRRSKLLADAALEWLALNRKDFE